ncbi:MAG: RNA methyltransferase [Desulfurococcales archaeon]|nr:RNA methyltransferase [Desulfurococcales archaeon]
MTRLRLVLVETEGGVNLGMIARLCENFDVDEFYLVNPKASLEEAKEYAVHAAHRLDNAVIVDSLNKALEGVDLSICTSAKTSERNVLREPITVREAADLFSEIDGIVGLVMGRESVGLTREELRRCDILSHIPSSPKYPALNLANATAIYLYEFYQARTRGSSTTKPSSRTIGLLDAYTRALSEILIHDEIKQKDVVLALKRIAMKNITRKREIDLLVYLLSKACRRIEGCEDKVSSYMQSRP